MKKRRERINKQLADLRKLKNFKKRVLRKGAKRVNTSTNPFRKKKSAKVSKERVEGNGLIDGSDGKINQPNIESEEKTP